MKKTARIVAALVLAVMLTAALSAAAWADDTSSNDGVTAPADDTQDTFSKTATVTVKGVAPGETVNLYKVGFYASDYHSFAFEGSFKDYLNEKKGAPQTAEQYFAGLTAPDTVRNLIDGFVNQNPSGLPATPDSNLPATAEGSVTFSGVEPGYYIITVQTTTESSRVYLPMSVFARVVGDELLLTGGGTVTGTTGDTGSTIELTAKYVTGPTIEKEVWCGTHGWSTQTDASVGDVCSFVIPLTIPAYTGATTLNLSIVDTMTGMSYVDGSAKVYDTKPAKADDAQTATAIENAVRVDKTDGLKFILDYGNIINGSTTGRTVCVFYQAVITADAAASGVSTNTAVLSYNRPDMPEQTTDAKTVNVYNYAFTLNKVNEKEEALSGATFSIYTTPDGKDPMKFTKIGTADGSYYVPSATGTVTVLPADSEFTIKGLGHGTYYVQEVSTPRGYFLPAGRFQLKLAYANDPAVQLTHDTLSGTASSFAASENADKELVVSGGLSGDRIYAVKLKNATLPVLPSTGGVGTAMFTVGGAAVMVLAAVLFLRRKKED